ncbi:MAG: hypothetical protein LQ338_005254 [Usnochroma carphineum]|nr:MAG: hypothetical protein LQ338_005254 [Usnochroma carphineum]
MSGFVVLTGPQLPSREEYIELQDELGNTKKDLANAKETMKRLRRELREKDSPVAAAAQSQESGQAQAKIQELQSILLNEIARAKSLETGLETCNETCRQLSGICTRGDEQIGVYGHAEQALRQRISSLEKDIRGYKHEQDSSTARFETANREISLLRAEATSTQAEVTRLKAQSNQAEASANKRVVALQTQIDSEETQFISELRTLLGVTSGHPWATFRRLRIPSGVVLPRRIAPYRGCLDARSIIRGRFFTAFPPSAQDIDHTFLTPNDWNRFSHAVCNGMIKVELCINEEEAKDRCIDLLWDIWGNLDNTVISRLQICRIAKPLAYIIERVLASCSEGKLPSFAFWLASQLAPDLPWPAKPDDATLVAAGYSCIKQGDKGLDLNQGETLNFFDSVFGTAERFPDNCLRFLQS